MTQQEFQQRYTYNPSTDRLGGGGFGEVFKAYDTHRDRWVALKIAKVLPEFESARLRKEVDMVSKLPTHQNIAYYEECYTFSSFDGEYDFGILQYYEEGNLLQLLKKGELNTAQKHAVLLQILSGLDFLHKNGIIHRDLKPQNILIVKRGREYIPKITDFGISKKLDVDSSSVFSNSLVGAGTLSYSSPEQLGAKNIHKNTDLWSFGVIVYQVLSGSLPFTTGPHNSSSEAGRQELFSQINNGRLPERITAIAVPWQQLIRSCLVSNTSQRIGSCSDCYVILSKYADNKSDEGATIVDASKSRFERSASNPVQHVPKLTVTNVKDRPKRKFSKWLLGVLCILCAFLGIVGYDLYRFSRMRNDIEKVQIDWVDIPAGTFTMGSPTGEPERLDSEGPWHQVSLSGFKMSKYAITFTQYDAFCDATSHAKPSDQGWGRGNRPVINVSWHDAVAFCNWVGGGCRLPTEAEWEYACRAGTTTPFHTGHNLSTAQGNYDGNYPYNNNAKGGYRGKTLAVGRFSPNAWGLYGMHGNVYEWCSDWFGAYSKDRQTNPKGPFSGEYKVRRGGSWYNAASDCRSAYRLSFSPDDSYFSIGFRVVSSK